MYSITPISSKRIFRVFSESDDEQVHPPVTLADLITDKLKQNNKLVL
jgi:hypothetical protein